MARITETQLILPSLFLMRLSSTRSLTTSCLITRLRNLLKPTGEDLEILENRNDDKFSQKVRNLKSHDAFEKRGFARYEGGTLSEGGTFSITEEGESYLQKNMNELEYLFE